MWGVKTPRIFLKGEIVAVISRPAKPFRKRKTSAISKTKEGMKETPKALKTSKTPKTPKGKNK